MSTRRPSVFTFTDADGDTLAVGIPATPASGTRSVSFYTATGEPVHVPVDQVPALIVAIGELSGITPAPTAAGAEADPAQPCSHGAWQVTGEHREADGWHKSRRCTDCGEALPTVVEAEPHWDIQPHPAAGQRWVRRAEPERGRVVTVTRVWAAGDDGHTAVAYEWRNIGVASSACPLAVFLGAYEPYTEQAEADAALSPTLRLLRDALLTRPGTTSAEALAGARQYLAAHARELAELVHDEVFADRKRNPGSGEHNRNYVRRGAMRGIRLMLDRYADDLDAAAVDGES